MSSPSSPGMNAVDVLEAEKKKVGAGTRVLVTGGCGFIGSHLVDYLMERGYEVIVADSYFTGKKENVAKWFGHPNFELIRHDVVEPLFVEVDQIYHMACPASPVHYQYNAIKTLKTNILGTMHMCGLAKRVKARILLASTSEVYGDPDIHPQVEEYFGNVNCIGTRSCYDEGKRAAETLSRAVGLGVLIELRTAPRRRKRDERNFVIVIVFPFCLPAQNETGSRVRAQNSCEAFIVDEVESVELTNIEAKWMGSNATGAGSSYFSQVLPNRFDDLRAFFDLP